MGTDREEFSNRANEMCDRLATDMHERMMEAFDSLTPDEISKFDTVSHSYYLVRAIGVIVGPGVVNDRFAVEAIKSTVRRVKTILNKRYW